MSDKYLGMVHLKQEGTFQEWETGRTIAQHDPEYAELKAANDQRIAENIAREKDEDRFIERIADMLEFANEREVKTGRISIVDLQRLYDIAARR